MKYNVIINNKRKFSLWLEVLIIGVFWFLKKIVKVMFVLNKLSDVNIIYIIVVVFVYWMLMIGRGRYVVLFLLDICFLGYWE